MDESGIIKGLASGDESAFEQLFRKHYGRLCLYAEHYVRERAAAEEIVEEFFVYWWDNHKSVQIESNLTGYIYRSIYTRCLKYLRHEKVKQKYLEERGYIYSDRELLEPVSGEIPEAFLVMKELEEKIDEALNDLPEQCRRVFEHSRFEGLSYQDIAGKMNISINSVKTHMTRALKRLRLALKDFLLVALIAFEISFI